MYIRGLNGLLLTVLAGVASAADTPVSVADVQRQNVVDERVFDAAVEAVSRSTVSAQASGRIVEINVDVDDYVEQGAVILRFRDAEPRSRLEAAEANHREAQARLAQARQEHERIKDVYERQLVAKATMDQAEAELKSAQARVNATAAAVSEAREQLEHTVVRAPYSGIVIERHVELGETASPGQPLMTGLSLEHLRAVVQLPQGLIDRVREQRRAYLVMPDGRRVEATQLTVFPYADADSHTFTVRVELPVGMEGLYPGMLVKIGFAIGEDARLLVPAPALVHRSEVTGVYVVDAQGRISFRQVRIGGRYDDAFEVLAGLEDGERVALDPIRAGVLLKEQRPGTS